MTRANSADHQHRYIALDQIDRIKGNGIYMKIAKVEAKAIAA